MIITSEDERYGETKGLDFFANHPDEGLLTDIAYGDNCDELFCSGDYEGLFYQLYHIPTGKRIGSGFLDYDSLSAEITEWEREIYQPCYVLICICNSGNSTSVYFDKEEAQEAILKELELKKTYLQEQGYCFKVDVKDGFAKLYVASSTLYYEWRIQKSTIR